MPSATDPGGETNRRFRLLRAIGRAVLIAAATLGLLEAALRLLPAPPFVPPAPLRGRIAHFAASDVVTVDYEVRTGPFTWRRPEGTKRIVCCGSSSTYGLGLPPQGAWPWRMDASLAEDAPVEVINLARVGATSSDQVHIVREALQLQPSCIVLMEGNNEFLPLMAARAAHLPLDPFRELVLLRAARHSRIVAWMRAAGVRPPPPAVADMPDPEGLSQVTVTDDDIALARETYRENLREIARMCARAKVPLLLCTVPVNLGWPPSVDDTPVEVRAAADEARRALDGARREQALALLEKTGKPPSATLRWLEYRIKGTDAVAVGREAVTLDRHPLRARTDFNEVVRQVAAESRLAVCDLSDLGDDLFLDGCHLDARGAEAAADRVREALRRTGAGSWPAAVRQRPAGPWLDLAHFGDLPTFLAAHGAALPPATVSAVEDGYRRHSSVSFALADSLPRLDPASTDNLALLALYGHVLTTSHRYRVAAGYYRRAAALDPAAATDLGWALYLEGRPEQALVAWPPEPSDRVTRRARAVLESGEGLHPQD